MTEIGGVCDPAFEPVRDAFEANFAEGREVGAACCVYLHGGKVVELWGGVADVDSGRVYDQNTLQLVFSTTKGAAATCVHVLAQRGQVDIDAPVAEYWPEFAQAGKEAITLRWLLCHKAGLPYVDVDLTLAEVLAWDPMIRALERQEPVWAPGTAHGYHACTFGWLVGEVVRRVTGMSLGAYFAQEVAGPLGLEFWIGLPEEQWGRVAPLIGDVVPAASDDPDVATLLEHLRSGDNMFTKAEMRGPGAPFAEPDVWNRPEVWAAEIPAGNGVTNARSLARMYSALFTQVEDGPTEPLLTKEQLNCATTCQTAGPDQVIGIPSEIGLGYWVSSPLTDFGGPHGFGHPGAGGSTAFGDPENGIGFGYAMNKLASFIEDDPRARNLVRATYDALGVQL
jgi:CubicO group peptidase (beta-lactamase class C family)